MFKARNEDSGKIVAVKFLHKGFSSRKRRELKNEAWVQSKLSHKNIVRCLDYEPDDPEGAYLVLEYVKGHSLQAILDGEAAIEIDPERAQQMIKSCLEALDYAHTHDEGAIIHGDIKPGNVLIPSRSTEEAKISDFGVARILGTRKVLRKGSSSYAAPEVLRSWKEKTRGWSCDCQSDLFSMGVVAYNLLTERHPFVDLSGQSPISHQIESENIKPPPMIRFDGTWVSEPYATLTMKLLEKERHYRYRSAQDVLNDIETGDPHRHIKVNLDFSPRAGADVSLDIEKCTYELRDGIAIVETGEATLAITPGGWQCKLPPRIRKAHEDNSVVIHLIEKNGKKWKVGPFYPFAISVGVE